VNALRDLPGFSQLPPPRWCVEKIASAFLLRIVGVLNLQPPDPRVIRVGKAIRDYSFEVVRAHKVEQLSRPRPSTETASAIEGKSARDGSR